jgi:hypothetical protein
MRIARRSSKSCDALFRWTARGRWIQITRPAVSLVRFDSSNLSRVFLQLHLSHDARGTHMDLTDACPRLPISSAGGGARKSSCLGQWSRSFSQPLHGDTGPCNEIATLSIHLDLLAQPARHARTHTYTSAAADQTLRDTTLAACRSVVYRGVYLTTLTPTLDGWMYDVEVTGFKHLSPWPVCR